MPAAPPGIPIVLVTHPGVGRAILHTVQRILGDLSLPVRCVEVPTDGVAYQAEQAIQEIIQQATPHSGVLLLTDLYGATPHNIAQRFDAQDGVAVLAGLNVPMLLRVLNYAHEAQLGILYAKAKEGAIRGIS